jgi:hypothetical protein
MRLSVGLETVLPLERPSVLANHARQTEQLGKREWKPPPVRGPIEQLSKGMRAAIP